MAPLTSYHTCPKIDLHESISITKTCLYNFDPLKPHLYIVKLGFTGVYIIFLISARNIDCGYSFEPPRRGGSNEYPQSIFWAEIWKIIRVFYLKNFVFKRWNFLYICFRNDYVLMCLNTAGWVLNSVLIT